VDTVVERVSVKEEMNIIVVVFVSTPLVILLPLGDTLNVVFAKEREKFCLRNKRDAVSDF
jgi:hypothetical protein